MNSFQDNRSRGRQYGVIACSAASEQDSEIKLLTQGTFCDIIVHLMGRYPEPKLIPTPPEFDTEELRRDHREVMKSETKLVELYDMLLREYPDQWVGLHHSLGVVHSDTRAGLRKEIQKHDFPRAQTAIEHLETNPKIMIL